MIKRIYIIILISFVILSLISCTTYNKIEISENNSSKNIEYTSSCETNLPISDKIEFNTTCESINNEVATRKINTELILPESIVTDEQLFLDYGYEIIACVGNKNYAKYSEMLKIDNEIVDAGNMILQHPVFENRNIVDMTYYISVELIQKYYDENLLWNGIVCSFKRNHLIINISDGMITADNEIFGKIIERECETFVINETLYIDINSIDDILGIKSAGGYFYNENLINPCFFVLTFPTIFYTERTLGKIKEYEYVNAEPIDNLLAEPIYISNQGVYYYKVNDDYYAEFNGLYFPLEVIKDISIDVPK